MGESGLRGSRGEGFTPLLDSLRWDRLDFFFKFFFLFLNLFKIFLFSSSFSKQEIGSLGQNKTKQKQPKVRYGDVSCLPLPWGWGGRGEGECLLSLQAFFRTMNPSPRVNTNKKRNRIMHVLLKICFYDNT